MTDALFHLAAVDPNVPIEPGIIPPEVQGFVSGTLLIVGALFCLLASIGVARMPDVYTRMQAATKAGTLGLACIILGVAAHFGSIDTAAEASLIVAFVFLTAPIASHLIARAAYFVNDETWEGMLVDEMADCYDNASHELEAPASFNAAHKPTLAHKPPTSARPSADPGDTPEAPVTG